MFQYLLELFIQFWDSLKPWVVVDQYEAGIVLRLGLWNRDIQPGLSWKIPFVETVLTAVVVITTESLRPQTLTTKDGKSIVVRSVVKYEIKKVKPYLLDIWDRADVLSDVTMAAVAAAVSTSTFSELIACGIEDTVTSTVRQQVNQYGFKIHKITFSDFGMIRSIRLITDTSYMHDNDESS